MVVRFEVTERIQQLESRSVVSWMVSVSNWWIGVESSKVPRYLLAWEVGRGKRRRGRRRDPNSG